MTDVTQRKSRAINSTAMYTTFDHLARTLSLSLAGFMRCPVQGEMEAAVRKIRKILHSDFLATE